MRSLYAIQPIASPKPIPPKTSKPKSSKISTGVTASVEPAILKSVRKTTTPTPSLKRDSPTIFVSNFLGAPAFFKIPKTAIGSVGEINAPKSKQ